VLVVADVAPAVVRGGGERALWEWARRLAARGHTVRVLGRADGSPPAPGAGGPEVRHFAVDRRSALGFLRAAVLAARRATEAVLAGSGADVLHLHQPLSGLGALGAPGARTLPSLYTFHSPAPVEYWLRRGSSPLHRPGPAGVVGAAILWAAERACVRRASRVQVLSAYSAELLRRLYGVSGARVVRIPGGADLERFRPVADRVALRRRLGLPESRPLVLTVRNLERRMGLDRLLAALGTVRRRWPEVLLVVAGTGSLGRPLAELARALGLEGHVRFLGFVDEATLPDLYATADLFVLPTRALEGFGLATVEALACGTPVVGTPVGATPELLAPLDPALLARDATAEGLAEALDRFLTRLRADPAGVAALRRACRHHAETHYDWEASVDGLERTLGALTAHTAEGCEVCGAPCREATYRERRYRVCPRCGTLRLAEPLASATLRAYYEHEYPRLFAPEAVSPARRAMLGGLLDRLEELAPARRLLDVGAGGGHLCRAARERGWCAVGSDLALEACRAALKAGAPAAVQADGAALPVRSAALGAVTLVNVLDHLPDPQAVLAEARRVLVDGGVLAVRGPNAAFHRFWLRALAWLGPLGRPARLGRYPVLHVWGFTPRGLARLVARAGFEPVAVRASLPAADGPAWRQAPADPAARWLRRGLALLARVLAPSGGGILSPSFELYARRRRAGS
jgi:glycosyltransferase involved in cell wall biosynthesis/SAM-dependent methyltransferase